MQENSKQYAIIPSISAGDTSSSILRFKYNNIKASISCRIIRFSAESILESF